jgi:hypothetical protein
MISACAGGYEIAALAAGGSIAIVDAALDGSIRNGYALVRPPGHHARADQGKLSSQLVHAIIHDVSYPVTCLLHVMCWLLCCQVAAHYCKWLPWVTVGQAASYTSQGGASSADRLSSTPFAGCFQYFYCHSAAELSCGMLLGQAWASALCADVLIAPPRAVSYQVTGLQFCAQALAVECVVVQAWASVCSTTLQWQQHMHWRCGG